MLVHFKPRTTLSHHFAVSTSYLQLTGNGITFPLRRRYFSSLTIGCLVLVQIEFSTIIKNTKMRNVGESRRLFEYDIVMWSKLSLNCTLFTKRNSKTWHWRSPSNRNGNKSLELLTKQFEDFGWSEIPTLAKDSNCNSTVTPLLFGSINLILFRRKVNVM